MVAKSNGNTCEHCHSLLTEGFCENGSCVANRDTIPPDASEIGVATSEVDYRTLLAQLGRDAGLPVVMP